MRKLIAILALVSFATGVTAQDYKVRASESSMSIKGTSTLHDWESDVEGFSAVARVVDNVITNASFKAEVKSIKSGTSAMDANTYKAMKEPDHPSITFKTTGAVKESGGALRIKGDLTISGVTKSIEFTGSGERWSEESLTVKGSYALLMSEYGIEPPKAMLGTIRTGDEVTIEFKFVMYK